MMPKKIFFVVMSLLLLACSDGDDLRNDNPNLVDVNFNLQLDLNLPQYNHLQFPGNSFVTPFYGINGIVIYNVNNTLYTAFEMTDPNHPIRDCSSLELNGIEVTCACDDGNTYNIITGQLVAGEGQYSLKPYRIEKIGSILEISN